MTTTITIILEAEKPVISDILQLLSLQLPYMADNVVVLQSSNREDDPDTTIFEAYDE